MLFWLKYMKKSGLAQIYSWKSRDIIGPVKYETASRKSRNPYTTLENHCFKNFEDFN